MNLTKAALKRPVSVFMIVLALIVFGISAIFSSPVELTPDMQLSVMMIMTVYPGAGPEEVEDLVTHQIETAVSTLGGVKNIQSQSLENMSMVILQMDYGTNMDLAHMDLQEKLDMYKNTLPKDVQSPTVIEMSPDMMPAITLSAQATGDVDLLYYVEEEIKPDFEKLSGVASVDVAGGQRDYIRVQLNEERMNQYHLDMNTLANVIGSANFSMPVGSIERGDQELSMRGGVSYTSTESLKNIPITLRSGNVIHLSDVAQVYEATQKQSTISRYNGKDVVSLNVQKRQSASTLDVTRAVTKTMKEINAQNKGIELSVIFDSSDQILNALQSVSTTLFSAIVLSMLVLFVFLGDWRASLIVGSSMPVSVLTTLILMHAMGFSINLISIGGLVIGVGMMVDNSIVVLESCFQRHDLQRNYAQAALDGTRIVTDSIIAGTITTIVVFLPISFMQGLSGQIFRQLGFTIIFSLTTSLISAMTLVPLMFIRMEPVEKKEMWVSRTLLHVEEAYGRFLKKTFRHKKAVVLLSITLLGVSLYMFTRVDFELMPDIDQGQIDISIATKAGLKLEELDKVLQNVENVVTQHPDVERYSMTGGGTNDASMSVYLKGDRAMKTAQVVDVWREELKDTLNGSINITQTSMMTAMTGGSDVQVNLQGNDRETLGQAALQVEELMRQNKGIVRVSSTDTAGNPQAEVKVDPLKASAIGLTPKQVVGTVYNMISGTKADTLRQNGRDYDIQVEYPKGRFQSVTDLSGMMLTSSTGQQVPLLEVAHIEYTNAPQSIQRKNNQYIVTITGQPKSSAKFTAGPQINAAVKDLVFPQGVSVTQATNSQQMQDEFTALLTSIAAAAFLVFMVMAMQFESTRFSLLVMLCVPFSLIGAVGLMAISNITMSLVSLMGFLLLVGTVVNNGILFIDTANQLRGSMDGETALIYAGKSRMRPILMTTLTTILAMIPLALGIGNGSEIMQGMAVVIVGGLTASTLLTLLLLPTFYLLFGTKKEKPKKPRKERKSKKAALKEPAPAEEAMDDLGWPL